MAIGETDYWALGLTKASRIQARAHANDVTCVRGWTENRIMNYSGEVAAIALIAKRVSPAL